MYIPLTSPWVVRTKGSQAGSRWAGLLSRWAPVSFLVCGLLACSDASKTQDAGPALDQATLDRAVADSPLADQKQRDQSREALSDWYLTDWAAPDIGAVPAIEWITIKAGSFTMGSPNSEPCREPDSAKETQHAVTLTHDFMLAKTEVTQAQFLALMWYNPSKNKSCGLDCPVETLDWSEAAALCNRLSSKAGLSPCYTCQGKGPLTTCTEAAGYAGAGIYTCPGYRLPTEAEWEHAYRAGTTTALYTGPLGSCISSDTALDKIGWYEHNSSAISHKVAQKLPNSHGLYDMAGNVWEWCNDWFTTDLGPSSATDPGGYTGSETYYRIIRSGAWFGKAYNLRAARRFYKEPTFTCHGTGVRPARTIK